MKKISLMKKMIFVFVLLFVLVGYGCAKTKTDEIFRLEVTSLEMTVGDKLEIGVVRGSVEEDKKVRYYVEVEEKEVNPETEEEVSKWVPSNDILKVTASSSDDKGSVGKVTENVKLEALNAGVVRLIVEVVGNENINDIIYVTITPEKLTLLDIEVEKTEYAVGEKGTATVKVYPADISKDVTWVSSDETLLTINEAGEFECLAKTAENEFVQIKAISKYDSSMVAVQNIIIK